MLQDLIKAAGRQGGTIHHFFPVWTNRHEDMLKAYRDYRRCGIEFPSKGAFDKLAKQYRLSVNWQ